LRSYEIGIKGSEHTTIVDAETAGKAKYSFLLDVGDCCPDISFANLTCRSMGRLLPTKAQLAQREADAFNGRFPVGTAFRYWRGLREGDPSGVGELYHPATVVSDHPVAWIKGAGSCVSLSHVEAV
jgi:hypothetical protein